MPLPVFSYEGDNMKNLLKVKSIVTLLLTVVVAYLAITGKMSIDQIYLMIIAFYFGTQHEQKSDQDYSSEGSTKG